MIGEHWEIRTKMLFVSILDLKETEPYYGKCLICNGKSIAFQKKVFDHTKFQILLGKSANERSLIINCCLTKSLAPGKMEYVTFLVVTEYKMVKI